ncbi:MAG: acyl-CoA thioesterase II, partial [Myxococcota bacterium]
EALHRCLLAYGSDFSFITTALRPHAATWVSPTLQVASLDHVMWFHQPLRMDRWLLHVMESPSASGARGFARGQVFDQSGVLVASTAQEGLMRPRGPAPS